MTKQPESVQGSVHADFERVAAVFRKQLEASQGGAALCIYHRGEKVVDCWGGSRDEHGTPWSEDTLALSFSTTKGVTSTLLHMLVDRGLLDYDDPVCEYWPEFEAHGKSEITVRQLMCHEAGLFGVRGMVDHARRILDWDYMVEALGDAVPAHEPGRAHGYHGLTYGWLVGELCQRVSGRRFGEMLETEIAQPLGLDGLYVGVPGEALDRRARQIGSAVLDSEGEGVRAIQRWLRGINRLMSWVGQPIDFEHFADALMPRGIEELDMDSAAYAQAAIPSANGMFTARSLARMYAALAGDGELDGVRLLRRETLWRATEVQNTGSGLVIPLPMHWRLGYHRVAALGIPVTRAFGHQGLGGSGAWADPERELALAYTVNSGTGTPFGDLRILRIGTAALRCAEAR